MKNVLDATEASNNTASTFQEHTYIIDHTFRLHKCTYANIKVGVAAKLQMCSNEQRFEHSNLLPSPNTDTLAHNQYTCNYHTLLYSEGNYIHVHVLGDYVFPSILIVFENY